MEETLAKPITRGYLNRNQIKYIVIIAMLIDHIAWGFVDAMAKQDIWTTYRITYKEGNAMNPKGFVLTDKSNPDNSYYFEPNFRYYHYSIWE